jgi:putative ABC transport system substrate-binding protein
MPVIGLVGGGGGDISTRYVTAFRKGLMQTGTIEGQNATVEYHWLAGQYDRLSSLMADLVRRRVAVIATAGSRARAVSVSEMRGQLGRGGEWIPP